MPGSLENYALTEQEQGAVPGSLSPRPVRHRLCGRTNGSWLTGASLKPIKHSPYRGSEEQPRLLTAVSRTLETRTKGCSERPATCPSPVSLTLCLFRQTVTWEPGRGVECPVKAKETSQSSRSESRPMNSRTSFDSQNVLLKRFELLKLAILAFLGSWPRSRE